MPAVLNEAPEALLTVDEVAQTLRLCAKSVYLLSKSGRLPSVKMNARRLYRPEDVRRFIESSVTNEAEGGVE